MATHRAPAAGDYGADPDGGPAESATSTATATATAPASPEPPAGSSNYKRASRKGAPRRFTCSYPACDKVYSRAEHLQRHQLNHNPKEIYQCDVPGCEQKFVRLDLLTRHKKRHSSSYIPRNRVPNFNAAAASGNQPASPAVTSPTGLPTPSPSIHQPPQPHQPLHSPPQQQQHQHHHHQAYSHVPRGPYNSSVLLTPSSNPSPQQTTLPHPGPPRPPHGNGWAPPPLNDMGLNMMHHKQQGYYPRDSAPLPGPTSLMAYSGATPDQLMARDNFAMWLFDPQTTFSDFGVANIPFLEGGLESAFNNDIRYDYESLASRSQPDPTPPRQTEGPDDLLGEPRRQEILRVFQLFRKKADRYEPAIADIARESGGDLPALNLEMMRDCVHEYWESVSPRLPIIHQPTFSANRCPILLLVVMVALGAASLRSRDGGGSLRDYGAFADVLIEGARWDIFMAEESTPPVALWAAQALLLLEFYEKLYSSRRFHERAHIYHTAILNNLRRGSPLIGRAGSESPPEEAAVTGGDDEQNASGALDSRAWWVRWAESESMHRVVFAAFMLDIIHAGMFGHAADMAPHEIRLPLPCDDNLWTAPTPDSCRQLDGSLRMYGVKQVSFLDGLKSALHGKEVKTHSFARMIIMSGLLSVAWHLSHRETHLRWLEARGGADAQDGWRRMLFRAFDVWKASFDAANGDADPRGAATGPILSAGVLYHLAHVCLHVDIVDCQVYAGARRLLGRKVSSRDYTNAVGRMRAWAKQPTARYAVLHAFKLLHRVLVGPRGKGDAGFEAPYEIRSDPDPHRPWIMYYAALSIWCFVRALNPSPPPPVPRGAVDGAETYRRAVAYLARGAAMGEVGGEAEGLWDGMGDLLDVMCGVLEGANSELLREALERFRGCRDLLAGVGA